MAKYMIHACNSRNWYVQNYLLRSLLIQGIPESDITIYLDKDGDGNLKSCLKSFAQLPDEGGTWHLQDDVIIANDFKKRTEEYEKLEDGLVCGFCCDYDDNREYVGETTLINMWWSFPCIRIPNHYAKEFVAWYSKGLNSTELKYFGRNGKGDDLLFRAFMEREHMETPVTLAVPNLVDHIDYLLGGSIVNKQRKKVVRSNYWDNDELIEALKYDLSNQTLHSN